MVRWHLEEIWDKVGEKKLEDWVAEITKDIDAREGKHRGQTQEEDEAYEMAWDDVHGGDISTVDLRRARREEIEFMTGRKIWTETSEKECWSVKCKAPVSVRWVDVNKGTPEEPEIRCRLVARDFKNKRDKDREDLFAATPPLEAKRALFSRAVTRRNQKCRTPRKLLFVDARKAHLNPKCDGDVYIRLPEEAGAESGMCGKLNCWLYGFRPAANVWESHYSSLLVEVGFRRELASPSW